MHMYGRVRVGTNETDSSYDGGDAIFDRVRAASLALHPLTRRAQKTSRLASRRKRSKSSGARECCARTAPFAKRMTRACA